MGARVAYRRDDANGVIEIDKILGEGIAYPPSDIDVIRVAGYGFSDHRGGPVWMADDIDVSRIVAAHVSPGERQ